MDKRFFAAACALAVIAAPAAAAASADPADPRATHPPLRFDTGLRPVPVDREIDPPKQWRSLNDRARALGGHAGHVGDASSSPSSPEAGAPSADKPAASSK